MRRQTPLLPPAPPGPPALPPLQPLLSNTGVRQSPVTRAVSTTTAKGCACDAALALSAPVPQQPSCHTSSRVLWGRDAVRCCITLTLPSSEGMTEALAAAAALVGVWGGGLDCLSNCSCCCAGQASRLTESSARVLAISCLAPSTMTGTVVDAVMATFTRPPLPPPTPTLAWHFLTTCAASPL